MGLSRKKITVKGKSGKTYQRSVMVRAGEAIKRTGQRVGRFMNKHKGKLAVAGAVLVGTAVAGHFANSRHIANMARDAANHARAQEAVRNVAKVATDHIRVNVDGLKNHRAKMREELDHIEQQMHAARRQTQAMLHGQHDTTRQVDDQRQAQRDRSYHINEHAMRERHRSAERSGHYSPDYGLGQKTSRLRLGSGLPEPPPVARPMPGSNKKSRKKKS